MSKIKLIHDNCFNYFPQISDKSIDLILCDLPYGTTHCAWDCQLDLEKLWKEYLRVIKDHGAIILFAQPPFDKVLACSNLRLFRYEWIWEKTRATGHLNSNRMPLKAHENILVFYKKLPTYNPIKITNQKPVNAFTKKKEVSNKSNIYNYTNISYSGGGNTDRYPRDILRFSPDKDHFHSTQKPVALAEYFIRTYTNENDLVLDNCMGAGTTGIACSNLNRQFIGIEIDKKFYEISCKRIYKDKS